MKMHSQQFHRYRFDLSEVDTDILSQHLSPEIGDTMTQGWEERTDAALMQLLRTVLAKSARDASAVPVPLALPTDASRIKKHVQLVCERLSKGMKLVRPKEKKHRRNAAATAPES